MGLIFSCCRRRKDDSEQEPLLPKRRVNATAEEILPSQSQLNKLADTMAAVKTGKLPSQEQLTRFLQSLLRSVDDVHRSTLSEPGVRLVDDLRDMLQALLRFGAEKNSDDVFQEVAYRFASLPNVPLHADVIVGAEEDNTLDIAEIAQTIPSTDEVTSDVNELVQALRHLSTIVLSSSTFRMILSDLFVTARATVADTVATMGSLAATVQETAETIEEMVRPTTTTSDYNIQETGRTAQVRISSTTASVSGETQRRWDRLRDESPARTKDAVIARLQQAMAQAHSNPAYQQALCTLLGLIKKYVAKASQVSTSISSADAPTVTPIVWADRPLADLLENVATAVARLARGHSMDLWIQRLHTVIIDFFNIPSELMKDSDERTAFRSLLSELGFWFDTALARPHYATSPEGQRRAEAIYDRARALLQEASHSEQLWARHVHELVAETDVILDAISNDKSTTRLLDSFRSLVASFSAYTEMLIRTVPRDLEAAQRRYRSQVQRDLLQWLLPRILRALHAVPMPRVEYTSGALDAAVDSMYLTPTSAQVSLVPDHIRVENWSEICLDMAEVYRATDSLIPAVENVGFKTSTRTRIRVEGVRVSARSVGYYVSYRLFGRSRWFSWLGYEDEGLVSVDVGERGAEGEGLKVDIELEFNSDNDEELMSDGPLFSVRQVHVDVPGLQVSLDRSKHWLLNKLLLQPLAGPTARAAAAWILRSQLESCLGSLGYLAGDVFHTARRSVRETRKELELSDYAHALWRVLGNSVSGGDAVEVAADEDQPEQEPFIATHTSATTKGIIRTTVVYPDEAAAEGEVACSPIEQSALAIGIGAQILPGKAGPHDADESQDDAYGPRELAREALDQVQTRVDDLVEAEAVVVERGTEVGERAVAAAHREQWREGRETRKGGWRSNAFDY